MSTTKRHDIGYVSRIYPYTVHMQREFSYKHKQSFYEFVIGFGGKASHYINEAEHILQRGDIILMKPGNSHDYKILDSGPYSHFDLYATANEMEAACRNFSSEMYNSLAADPLPLQITAEDSVLNMLQAKLTQLSGLQSNPALERTGYILYRNILVFVCGLIAEATELLKTRFPDWLTRLLSDMCKPEVLCGTLAKIVQSSGFSHGHLCKLFKQYTGTTLVDYFSRQKSDYANVLLKNKDLSITDISAILGYDSLSYFIQVFKKYNGTTPKQYRKQLYTQRRDPLTQG